VVEGDGDAAGLQMDAFGEALKFLRHDLGRGFDEELGPFEAFLPQLAQSFGDFPTAPAFIIAVVALGEAREAGDQDLAVHQAVGADVVGDARGQDLLGAAAADAEEKLNGSAIDERARGGPQLFQNVVEFREPRWFGRHLIDYVSAHLRKIAIPRKMDKDNYPSLVLSCSL
jgi:hypothetical protein